MTAEPPSAEAAFRSGERQGLNPVAKVTDGPTLTTQRSDWYGLYCKRCLHKFELDDPVLIRIGPDGRIAEVRHNDRLAPWCGDVEAEAGDSPVGRPFFEAIDREDPPRTTQRRLLPGDPLLKIRDTVRDRDRRARCFVCTGSFRPYEFVVTCMCRPDDPQECMLSAHRDPAKNKLCYEKWLNSVGGKVTQCPMDMHFLGGG